MKSKSLGKLYDDLKLREKEEVAFLNIAEMLKKIEL